MRLLKKINNNYCLAIDDLGTTVIVSGRGIGFLTLPVEITDLSIISKSYYDIDKRYVDLLSSVDEECINASESIVAYAESKLNTMLNINLVFTLADHIEFCIKRLRKGIVFDYGISYEMEYLHAKEMQVAKTAVNFLTKKFNLKFPKTEASIIAMHILESENVTMQKKETAIDTNIIIHDFALIIKDQLGIELKPSNFNYYRFATHVQYLLERKSQNQEICSENIEMFESIKNQYPDSYQCAIDMRKYLIEKVNYDISDEELLYLMLHINRLGLTK